MNMYRNADEAVEFETCLWCRLESEKSNGSTHRYLESSPGCWASYGEILAKEYSGEEYFRVHELTVDAYALQHPGIQSLQTMSSVNVHLASLYRYFKQGVSENRLSLVKKAIVVKKNDFEWLEPPKDLKAVTSIDVLKAKSAAEHCELIEIWAKYVFEQWKDHHVTVEKLLK